MFGFKHGRLGSAGTRTLIQRAIASLRARGGDAHLWLPGGDVKTYGPELVANGGPFTVTTGWAGINGTLGVSSGSLSIANNGTVYGDGGQLITVVAGRTYSITGTYRNGTAGSVSLYYGATRNSGTSVNTSSVTNIPFSATYLATSTSLWVSLVNQTNVSGQTSYLSSISVREITSITSTILSGLTTGNYLESTGNSLATVDNPCGLVLDALGSVGVELAAIGSWNGATGDTVINSGVSTFTTTNSIGYGSGCNVTDSLISGKTYTIIFTVAFAVVGSGITAMVGGVVRGSGITTSGTYTATVTATGTNKAVIFANAAGVTFTISAVSVREVSGIHLTQATTQNKPVLRRGLTNLLTYSSDFGNAAWSNVQGVSSVNSSAITYINGALASKIIPAATTLVHGKRRSFSFVASQKYSIAFIGKQAESGINVEVFAYTNAVHGVVFDLTTGAASSSTFCTTESLDLGGGWRLFVTQITANSTITNNIDLRLTRSSSRESTFVGDGSSGVYFYSAGVFDGTLTASEILAAGGIPVTTTAAASNPNAGKYSWSFDGSNDSLALGSVPFQMGDDHCVIAGVTPTRATDYVLNLGSGAGIQQIAAIYLSGSVVAASWVDDASTVATTSELVPVLGVSKVVSATKMSDAKRIRINSVQQGATNNTAMGVTTVTTGYIGGFKPASYPFNGSTGPVLAIKGTVTDAELLMYERLVASLTPGAPTF